MSDLRMRNPGIGFLLSQLGGQSAKHWTGRLERLGLEPREVMLFRFVALAEGHSQSEVARAIGLPASRIVALVDRLEERGWVERRTSADDRRTHALHVTPSGHAVIEQIAAVSAEHETELSLGLTPEERTTLLELLGRMASAQGLIEGVHPGFADGHAEQDGADDEPGTAPAADSSESARMGQ
jgi:DNA-binding MarR family transcriptional regulator